MNLTSVSFFKLASQRMEWLSARQKVTAENVANANTPNFKARDVAPFAEMLEGGTAPGRLAVTHPGHRAGAGGTGTVRVSSAGETRTLDGNGVDLEAEAMKATETSDQYRMAADLYRKGSEMLTLAVKGSR